MDANEKSFYGKWHVPYDLSKWDKQINGYSIDGCAVLSEANLVFIFRKEVNQSPDIKLIRFFREEKTQVSGSALNNVKDIGYIIALDDENSLWVTNIGDVYHLGKDKNVSGFEEPIPNRDSEFGYRTIKGLSRIGSSIYAAGGWRHVFKRIGKNNWLDITKNIDRSDIIDKKGKGWNTSKSTKTGFGCVGGIAEDDMYAGGKHGECWHYDGKNWRPIDLPTNEFIYKIVAISSDQIYMACGGGILLEGSKDTWKVIKHPGEKDNFSQMVLFKISIYVATQFQMYKLVEGKLVECNPAKQNVDIEVFCHHYLSANDDIMLMCGQTCAALFDGENWFSLAPNA